MADTPQFDPYDVSHVGGNAPEHVKRFLGSPFAYFRSHLKPGQRRLDSFGREIEDRMRVTELSIAQKVDEPTKMEARAVMELDVTENMLNAEGSIHGGCSACLIDVCASFALNTLHIHNTGKLEGTVSQSLNVVYHSPAVIGEKLRVINTTLTRGNRTESARSEIWNVTHHRLVASGVLTKMAPSPPPAGAKL